MFSTLHISTRAILLAALIGASALAVATPARAQSITPDRALLNKIAAGPGNTSTAFTHAQAAPAFVEQGFFDGERALLNRPRAPEYPLVDPRPSGQWVVLGGQYVDGVRALLNRSSL